MAAISKFHQNVLNCGCGLWFVVWCIALEEEAEANAVFVKEVHIAQDRAIIKGVARLVAGGAWACRIE